MTDTETGKLLTLLLNNPEIPLRFYLEGVPINQGYHVTEVKHASIKSMDCGKHTDAWEEILIQLLDGEASSEQGLMSASKFMSIVRSSIESFSKSSTPFLYFEFSTDNGPLQKLRINSIDCDDRALTIHLTYEKASCKPFKRWGKAGALFNNLSAKVTQSGCCSGRAACCG